MSGSTEFLQGEVQALPSRGLTERTCEKFGYRIGTDTHGRKVQIADYRANGGQLVFQKVKFKNDDGEKEFYTIGDAKAAPLFGQHLWSSTGKRIVVVEGEVDALSLAQAFNLSWPVVSIPSGAKGAKKALQRSLEWLLGYEQIVLCMDNDDVGRAAVAECAPLFPPGRCAIAELPLKDSNEMLVAGRTKELCQAIWNARTWRPGGIVNGADLWDRITSRLEPGIPYPWEGLSKMTYGQRHGKLVTWTSGTGMGKSTAVAQVAYELAFKHGCKVGYVALEEDVGRAAQRFLSHHMGKLVHLPGVATEEEMKAAFDSTLAAGRVFFYDHFGSTDSDDLIGKLRYLAKGVECDVLVLDHLSIVVSGMDLTGDERRTIDRTMTLLRTLVEETGVLMHLVSHLRRIGDDKGHEEGARVSLAHLRGSQSIAQLSDLVIGLERNQQAAGDEERLMTCRVLKNRDSGETGIACYLDYDRQTGKLSQVGHPSAFEDETGGRDF